MNLEVRCCCNPKKLLGWIQVPEHMARPGMCVTFALYGPFRGEQTAYETLSLPVAEIHEGWRSWVAVKADETPIETLRRIRGFREWRPDHG